MVALTSSRPLPSPIGNPKSVLMLLGWLPLLLKLSSESDKPLKSGCPSGRNTEEASRAFAAATAASSALSFASLQALILTFPRFLCNPFGRSGCIVEDVIRDAEGGSTEGGSTSSCNSHQLTFRCLPEILSQLIVLHNRFDG